MRHVDADPRPPELLRRMDRRAAAAEWVKNQIAAVARCPNNSFEKWKRFLGRIP
jgi:hypothetical protein